MDGDSTEFLTMITSLLGLMMAMLALNYGLLYFVGSLAFIAVLEGLFIVSYIVDQGVDEDKSDTKETVNPVKSLQEQFAKGKITEEQFEKKLDRIVEAKEVADEIDDESVELLQD